MLCVDLIGTCYDILNKPVPLMQRHVDIFRHKVIMGIHNRPRKTFDDISGEKSFISDNNDPDVRDDDDEINQEIPIDDPS